MEGESESSKSKLEGRIISLINERKKGGEMLLIGKNLSSVDPSDLLIDIEVSRENLSILLTNNINPTIVGLNIKMKELSIRRQKGSSVLKIAS